MRPTVATVLTSIGWERDLVMQARAGASVRILRRCHTASDVERVLDRIDAVVIGAETSWISAPLLRRWTSTGVEVLGMAADHDRPGAELLRSGGAIDVLSHQAPPGRVIGAVTSLARRATRQGASAPIITVCGARGSPGRTEVALGIAWAAGRIGDVLLVEADADAPGLGIRLGLTPSGGLQELDPARTARTRGRRHGPIEVLTWPPGRGPLSQSIQTRVVEAARAEFDAVIVDAGPSQPHRLEFDAGRALLVVHPTPNGLVRAGRFVADWDGPPPLVIANRVAGGGEAVGDIRLVRAATGLEPAAVIPLLEDIEGRAGEPASEMVSLLEPIARALLPVDQRSAAR